MALTFTPFPDLGNPCPDFSLMAVDGKTYKRSDITPHTPFVVMFICNHCPYVQAIEDRLITLGADLHTLGVPLLAICSNDAASHPEDSYENLKKRAEEKSYTFPYLHDPTQETAKAFGAVCTPDFFVYDRSHQLAYRGRLDDSWKAPEKVTKRELYNAVQDLLNDHNIQQEQVASMGCSIKWV